MQICIKIMFFCIKCKIKKRTLHPGKNRREKNRIRFCAFPFFRSLIIRPSDGISSLQRYMSKSIVFRKNHFPEKKTAGKGKHRPARKNSGKRKSILYAKNRRKSHFRRFLFFIPGSHSVTYRHRQFCRLSRFRTT